MSDDTANVLEREMDPELFEALLGIAVTSGKPGYSFWLDAYKEGPQTELRKRILLQRLFQLGCAENDLLLVGAAVSLDVDPNEYWPKNNAPIHLAAENERLEILERLLAIPTIKVDLPVLGHSKTALSVAVKKKRQHAAKLLIQKGAEINIWGTTSSNPLFLSLEGGDFEMAKHLLSCGAQLHCPGEYNGKRCGHRAHDSVDTILAATFQSQLAANVRSFLLSIGADH